MQDFSKDTIYIKSLYIQSIKQMHKDTVDVKPGTGEDCKQTGIRASAFRLVVDPELSTAHNGI